MWVTTISSRLARASACSSRSLSSTRLGSPVRLSCTAMWPARWARCRTWRMCSPNALQSSGLSRNDVAPAESALSMRGPALVAGQHDDGNVLERGVAAHGLDELQAVEVRHLEIDDGEIELRRLQVRQGVQAVLGLDHVGELGNSSRHHRARERVVVDNQNRWPSHGFPVGSRRSGAAAPPRASAAALRRPRRRIGVARGGGRRGEGLLAVGAELDVGRRASPPAWP